VSWESLDSGFTLTWT
jgi:cytosolic carboxypeptidase protein 5